MFELFGIKNDVSILISLLVIFGLILTVFFTSYRGFCRPCYNAGIERRLYRATVPDKWECRECRKKH